MAPGPRVHTVDAPLTLRGGDAWRRPLRQPGVRDVYRACQQDGFAGRSAVMLGEVRRGADEQRPAILASEHAREEVKPIRRLDLLDDLPARSNPDASRLPPTVSTSSRNC